MKPGRPFRTRRAERGVAAVVFVMAASVLLGFIGLAVDLGRLYVRKAELREIADAAALGAAGQLDGTYAGVGKAFNAAKAVVRDAYYDNGSSLDFYWNNDAVSFSDDPYAPDSAWIAASAVKAADAPKLLYARFDTSKLAALFDESGGPGAVAKALSTILPGVSNDPWNVSLAAVAGKLVTPITPLAVCAMSINPTGSHVNANGAPADKTAYGFRTGVSYNLLQLNPNGTTRQAFLVDPVDNPIEKNNPHFTQTYMQPFMCSGSMAMGQVTGKDVYIKPLPTDFEGAGWHLVDWLNSRFGASSLCNANGAPPDTNVREFHGNFSGDYPSWYMATDQFPKGTADSTVRNGNSLVAFPDLAYKFTTDAQSSLPTPLKEICFGPLWAYSKPVDANTGATLSTSKWPDLYQYQYPDPNDSSKTLTVKVTAASASYPTTKGADTPYLAHVLAPPSGTGVAGRRVLNIPLIDCSADTSGGVGKVVAVGRFFMNAKATPTAIPGEFAGISNITGPAVLFR
jgi:hypothetical protein